MMCASGDYEGTDYYIKKSEAIEIVKQGGDANGVCKEIIVRDAERG